MNQIVSFITSVVFSVATMLSAIPAVAQVQETPAIGQTVGDKDDAMPVLTLTEIETTLAAIEADSGMEDAVKDLLRTKYREAIKKLQAGANHAAKAVEYRESMTQAPGATANVRAQLAELPSVENAGEVAEPANSDDLQQALDGQRANLTALNEQFSSVTADLSRAEQRPAEISARIPEAKRELVDVRKQLASPDLAAAVTSPSHVADRFLLRARELKLFHELEMLKQDQLSQSVRRNLQQAQKELLMRQIENASAAVAAYETLMNTSVTGVARNVGARAEKLRLEVPQDDQEAVSLAAEVQELANQLEGVLQDKQKISAGKAAATAKLQRLTQRYDSIKKQLELDQPGVEMAQVLIDLRALLYSRSRETAQLRQWPTLGQTRLSAVQVDIKIDSQSDLRKQFAERSSRSIRDLLEARSEVLDRLQQQYSDLIPMLASLESEMRLYSDKAGEIRAEISQQLFWIRNSPPLSVSTCSEIPSGLRWAFGREHWLECRRALKIATSRAPIRSVIVVLFAIVLLTLRPRIGALLRRTGDGVGRVSKDRFGLTGKAVLWTTFLALPVPLLVGFVASALAQADAPSLWLRDINRAMPVTLLVVSAAAAIVACCYPGGLGDLHFGWRKELLSWLRRGSQWFAFVYVPLAVLAYCTLSSESGRFLHSLGRASLLFALAWLLGVFVRLCCFSKVLQTSRVRDDLSRPVARARYLGAMLAIGCLLGLMLLIGLGYTMTALNLSFALVLIMIITLGGVVCYALALRWFKIEYRKLSLTKALERRRARVELASEEQREDSQEVITVDEDEQELDLDSVGEQTRSVLRLFFGLAIAIAVFSLLSQTLPLIPYLDTIRIPMTETFSLLELAKAALVVSVTWLVTKNLPGILEFAVLRATTIDAGTRHAISTLCQYAVAVTGFVLLFNVLNLDWTQFGWIAGGLSVGIGFGMQEVIANFVCGLILLLERPIRVGDVVTVEGTTGTVTRLQMRATTITNWDRQDFVVPNKSLITGTILNWTLSAPLTRIMIPVGVAYGSDTDKARQILLDAAANHPRVLDDPVPMATFEQFGDSSLNLVLRAYLPDLDNRLRTITDLHTEISQRLAAAGIEIAFPQRDVHIRNGLESAASNTDVQKR